MLSLLDYPSLCSSGQNLTALSTAAGKNLTAVRSSHSLTETVNLGTVTTAGLIGTLHMVYTSCQNHICSTALRPQQRITIDHNWSFYCIITESSPQVNYYFPDFYKRMANKKNCCLSVQKPSTTVSFREVAHTGVGIRIPCRQRRRSALHCKRERIATPACGLVRNDTCGVNDCITKLSFRVINHFQLSIVN